MAAAEPILTLAMAKPDAGFNHRAQITSNRSASNAALTPASTEPFQPIKTRMAEDLPTSSAKLWEKRPTEPRNPLAFTRRSARENSHATLWASASVQAGYGEIFHEDSTSTYGHSGAGWQEPSCGFLKLRVRF